MPSMTVKVLVLVLVAGLALLSFTDQAFAQRRDSDEEDPTVAEGLPWGPIAVSVGFAAAIVFLGFLNAKRTHLD